jgi:hypothetical protein
MSTPATVRLKDSLSSAAALSIAARDRKIAQLTRELARTVSAGNLPYDVREKLLAIADMVGKYASGKRWRL